MAEEITQDDIEDAAEEDPRRKFMDPETLRLREEYLKDWRWRMSTHMSVQRSYMRGGHGRAGEND